MKVVEHAYVIHGANMSRLHADPSGLNFWWHMAQGPENLETRVRVVSRFRIQVLELVLLSARRGM